MHEYTCIPKREDLDSSFFLKNNFTVPWVTLLKIVRELSFLKHGSGELGLLALYGHEEIDLLTNFPFLKPKVRF